MVARLKYWLVRFLELDALEIQMEALKLRLRRVEEDLYDGNVRKDRASPFDADLEEDP